MNKNNNNDDWLKPWFSRMTKEELPASFRDDMMKRIEKEVAQRKKRNEWLGWLTVILASSAMIGLAVATLLHAGIPHMTQREWEMPELLPFYLYIGVLALLLLGFDHLLRWTYKRKHP
jgi:hypothetical protein